MAEALYTWTPAQFTAHEVLIAHQRDENGACSCGAEFDTTFAGHVVDEFGRAGLVITEPAD